LIRPEKISARSEHDYKLNGQNFGGILRGTPSNGKFNSRF